MRTCKYCNNEVDAKRGLVCYKCRYDIDKEYQLKKRLERKYKKKDRLKRDLSIDSICKDKFTLSEERRIYVLKWICKQYDNKLRCDLKTLLVDLITIFDLMGGNHQKIDYLEPSEQLYKMWLFIDNEFKKKYNLEDLNFI